MKSQDHPAGPSRDTAVAASRRLDVRSFLVERVAALAGAAPEDVDPAEELSYYGVDSQDLLTLIFELEDRYATRLHPGLFVESGTIDALAERIASAL
jgi:acyl carrier protein